MMGHEHERAIDEHQIQIQKFRERNPWWWRRCLGSALGNVIGHYAMGRA